MGVLMNIGGFFWALHSDDRVMKKMIKQGQCACDEILAILFCVAYFTRKQPLPNSKFSSLCSLFVSVKIFITQSMYYNEKLCVDLVACKSTII